MNSGYSPSPSVHPDLNEMVLSDLHKPRTVHFRSTQPAVVACVLLNLQQLMEDG